MLLVMYTDNIFRSTGVCSVSANRHQIVSCCTHDKIIFVEPPSSVLNMTLPAFAAQRRHLLHSACSAPRSYRSISPARRAISSKLASRRCSCRSMGQTDRRKVGHLTVTWTLRHMRTASTASRSKLVVSFASKVRL